MRRFMLFVAGLALLAGAVAAVSGGGTQAQARWVITDLGTLGGKRSLAVAIDERGQIVGNSTTANGSQHAFLWEDGDMRDLGTLGGRKSAARAINGRGQIVGASDTRSGREHAFLWQNGKMRDLGTLGGQRSDAGAINDKGQVIGWAETKAKGASGSPLVHAFLWQNGKMRDLGTLGGQRSEALAINEHGQVVGRCDSSSPSTGMEKGWKGRACLWQAGKVINLDPGPLGGGVERMSRAIAINERGEAAVNIDMHDGYTDAFLWRKGGSTRLHSLENGELFWTNALNEQGQVVGTSQDENLDYCPVLWRGRNAMNLGVLPHAGGNWGEAHAINDRGQIVGHSGSHAFLRANRSLTDLGVLPADTFSNAVAINGHDQVAGWSSQSEGPESIGTHAVLWTLKL